MAFDPPNLFQLIYFVIFNQICLSTEPHNAKFSSITYSFQGSIWEKNQGLFLLLLNHSTAKWWTGNCGKVHTLTSRKLDFWEFVYICIYMSDLSWTSELWNVYASENWIYVGIDNTHWLFVSGKCPWMKVAQWKKGWARL